MAPAARHWLRQNDQCAESPELLPACGGQTALRVGRLKEKRRSGKKTERSMTEIGGRFLHLSPLEICPNNPEPPLSPGGVAIDIAEGVNGALVEHGGVPHPAGAMSDCHHTSA